LEALTRVAEPRTLLIDVETFPALVYVWRIYEDSAIKVVENTSVASFSAKWLNGSQVTKAISDYSGYRPGKRDDRKLLKDLWTLLDEADTVVAHNGDRFDVKKINSRFIIHGMVPPSPYKTVDTLKEARAVSGHDSNRLNELCRQWGIGQKVRTGGHDLWFDCLGGDARAWKRMKKYNAHDVFPLLEGAYLRLLPWMKKHPNVSAFRDEAVCPRCGSSKIQSRGKQVTSTRTYQRFQCSECGGWSRGVESIEGRASLVIAR
jgi:predicted RNA-binding Zn-ribbon protein involved in translation (DUF1610 family)